MLPYDHLMLKELEKFYVEELKVDPLEQNKYDILCEKLKNLDSKNPIPVRKLFLL